MSVRPGERCLVFGEPGVVLRFGRDAEGIYSEVSLDIGQTIKAHRSAPQPPGTATREPCAHCDHARDAHENVGDKDCVLCSCVRWIAPEDER